MIVAGSTREIHRDSGDWAFVDIGFAREGKTCALLVGDGGATCLTFGDLRRALVDIARSGDVPLNLVLEAPLSVAFTEQGNPTGRSIERNDQGHRYWYAGLGCQVMLSAAYLLQAVRDVGPARSIRLFEAFVTFKQRRQAGEDACASHRRDVEAMREVVWRTDRTAGEVIEPDALRGPHADRVVSAFEVFGFDLDVPPVIVAHPRPA